MVLLSLLTAPAVLTFAIEILSARRVVEDCSTDTAPPFTVLVPAHNERAVIAQTLACLMPQMRAGDHLLVIADNCDDDTASIALECGAEVTSRNEPEKRGKGYALAHGLSHAAVWNTPVIIVVDADCQVNSGGLKALASQVARTGRPVQGAYTLTADSGASRSMRFSAFALRIKNYARLLGCSRLGMPCVLTGSGMAFPKEALERVTIGSGEIVEDLLLAVDLALQGYPTSFCAEAEITSPLPTNEQAAAGQRQRWEQGFLSIMRRFIPRLIAGGIRRRDWRLIALGLDVAVPPLSLLGFALFASLLASFIFLVVEGRAVPVAIVLVQIAIFFFAVLFGWHRHGRQTLSGADLLTLPLSVLRKIGFYTRLIRAPQRDWVRTARDGGGIE